jgi:hypothetical protein
MYKSIEELSNKSDRNQEELTDEEWINVFKYHRNMAIKSFVNDQTFGRYLKKI